MELEAFLKARDSSPGQRVLRAREIVDEMEFCRGATDLETLRSRVLTISYWEDSLAVERIQLLLNVKAIAIIRSRNGRCEITQEGLPGGVEYFDTDQFFVAQLDGSHYELMGDAPGWTSFQYSDIAVPIREILLAAGCYSAMAEIAHIIRRPQNANPEAEPAGRWIARKRAASQMETSRARAKDNDSPICPRLGRGVRESPESTAYAKWEIPVRTAAPSVGMERWRGKLFVARPEWSSSVI